MRSPRLGVQPAVAPGGSSGGLLDRAQNRLKGRSRPRTEHDRPGMIEDTPQCDRHWPFARQQAASMAGHCFDLLRRYLVKGEPEAATSPGGDIGWGWPLGSWRSGLSWRAWFRLVVRRVGMSRHIRKARAPRGMEGR
jgi:hypothetical protein